MRNIKYWGSVCLTIFMLAVWVIELELRSLIFDTHLDRWRYLFIFNFRTPDSPTRKWTHRHENVSGKFKRRKMMNLALCLEHVVFIWRGERKRRNRRYRFRKMVNNYRSFLLASIIPMVRYVSVWYVYFMSNLCHAVYLLYRKSFMSLTVWNKTQLFSYPPFLTVYHCLSTEWREWRKRFTFKYFMEATKSCG